MRRFRLERREDATGISGTGPVAEGVVFTDGTAVLQWVTKHVSTAVYESITKVQLIHGHDGRTVIVWEDFGPIRKGEADERRKRHVCEECGTGFPDCGCVVTDWGTGQTFHRKGDQWLLGDGQPRSNLSPDSMPNHADPCGADVK